MIAVKLTEMLKKSLEGPLPGTRAQEIMATAGRHLFPPVRNPEDAAVLLLIYPLEGTTGIVFIKRNDYDGPHSGQVSFPGGRREEGDRSLKETALRETFEELGIAGEIEVLGRLTKVDIQVSNFRVTPYVAFTPQRPIFDPDPSEVQYVIECTLEHLLEPATRDAEKWSLNGQEVEVPFYRVGDEKIWGATAMMLAEFLQLAARQQEHRRL